MEQVVSGQHIQGSLNVQTTGSVIDPYAPISISNDYDLVPILETRSQVLTLAHNGGYYLRPKRTIPISPQDVLKKARQELEEMVTGHKRKMLKEFNVFETPRKPVSRSGPPTVETSPVSPMQRENLKRIRTTLFGKNFQTKFEQEGCSVDSPVLDLPSNDLKNETENPWGLDVDDFSLSPIPANVPIATQQDLEYLNPNNDFSADLLTPSHDFMTSQIFDHQDLIKVGVDPTIQGSNDANNCKIEVSTATSVPQDIDGDETGSSDDDNDDAVTEAASTCSVLGERIRFRHPQSGSLRVVWFQRPTIWTNYYDLITDRQHLRFLVHLVVKRLRDANVKAVRMQVARKLNDILGYGYWKKSDAFHVLRGLVERSFKIKPNSAVNQFEVLLNDPDKFQRYNNAASEIVQQIV